VSTSALAMAALVKEYAWAKTLLVAWSSAFTTASVQPPWGEKKTSILGSEPA